MSDKNLDKDKIPRDDEASGEDISFKEEPSEKVSDEDIDRMLASALNDDEEDKPDEQQEEPADEDDTDETEETSDDEEDDEEEDSFGIGDTDDLKKHFGKSNMEDEEDDEEEDEADDEDDGDIAFGDAAKKPAKKKTSSSGSKSGKSGKKSSGKKKKKKKRIGFNGSIFGGIILVTIILTVSMLLAVGGLTIGMEFYGIGKSENDISFNIPEGSSNEDIAELLYENGIINNKELFVLAVRFVSPDTIYPGDITLQPSMPYSEIIEKMAVQRERYETVTITFYEGEYLTDVAARLEENGVCTAEDFLFEFNRNLGYDFEKYLTDVDNVFYAREGYFFPDTYDFYVGDTAFNIAKTLRDHYNSKLNDAMYKKMNDMGLTLNDTITLASIVQMEAANVNEMPNVASVFLNRLDDPDTFPRLESDTTYKYINEVISKKAGNDDTIAHYTEYYDTYSRAGLPAGPICNPGIEAINAVLNPSDTDYYYFCNNLETGETFYAKTLEEHEENLILAGLADPVEEE